MMGGLDVIDVKLFNELKENVRENIVSFSKKFGILRIIVYYRIKCFVDEGIIEKFMVKLNYKKFDLGIIVFILVCYDFDLGFIQREVVERIVVFDGVYEVYIIFGEWDMMIKVCVLSVEEVGKIVVDKLREIKGIGQMVIMVLFVIVKEEF